MKNIALLITILTIFYAVLLVVVFQYSKTVADPTQGGISRSEVLEGIIPGGINTLLVFLVVFLALTFGSWVIYFAKPKK